MKLLLTSLVGLTLCVSTFTSGYRQNYVLTPATYYPEETIRERLDDLETEIDDLETKIKKRLDDLETKIDALQDAIDKLTQNQ